MEEYIEKLRNNLQGDVVTDERILTERSHDASLFEIKPRLVIFPKNGKDVEMLIKITGQYKNKVKNLSLTARSAGTDMSGGPLNDSVIVDFTKYFNSRPVVSGMNAVTEPGVYYRDFEKETLRHGLIFPSYPASKTICAMGGIVNNNSGGEKSLRYGKTEKYVRKMSVVLSDGNTYEFKKLKPKELSEKLKLKTFEGETYRKVKALLKNNKELIQEAKPKVVKNSAGYNLWNIMDEQGNFDMTQLFVGSQGTLGIMTEAEIGLVPVNKYSQMVIVFLPDLNLLSEAIETVMPFQPESFESYDDNTLKLALRYFPEFFRQFGVQGMIKAALAFMPAFLMMFTGRLPRLVMQIGFSGDSNEELTNKVSGLVKALEKYNLKTQVAVGKEMEKYWLVRRESFNLLRKKIRGKHTAPFIDDFVIDPEKVETVLPKVIKILEKYPEYIFTVAGHLGEGNFHIIPIVDIKDNKVRESIPVVAKEVYEVVVGNGGSITGEHNDGLIRTPFLDLMYGTKVTKLFEDVKKIFDPKGIFNPRKKVNGDLKFAMDHLRENW